jgi:hypothetical protein
VSVPFVCRGCGEKHNKTNWEDAERVFRSALSLKAIPEKGLGPHRAGPVFSFNLFAHHEAKQRFGEQLGKTWNDHLFWVHQQAHLVNVKGKLGVANYSVSGGRREVDMDRADSFYFDCDGSGTWENLARVLKKAGIPAYFHESSSSVRGRAEGDTSLPLKWHVVIPLVRSLSNPLAGLDLTSPEARYARREWKRRYRHAAAVLSALAGFVGIGSVNKKGVTSCGFDSTTAQMCQIRFLGARQEAGGVPPQMVFLEGQHALDWDGFLRETGYSAGPMNDSPAIKTVRVPTPEGKVREYAISGAYEQLDEDIRNGISVKGFLSTFCGYTEPHSGTSHYCCVLHYETTNLRSMHVYPADVLGGNEMWHCHGDCGTSGDVIRLGQLFWGGTRKQARGRLADHLGLDMENYRPKITRPPVELAPTVADGPVEVEPEAPVSTGKKKRVPRAAPEGLAHVTEWAKKYVVRYGRPSEFSRAVAKVLLENKIAADVIATTLWPIACDHYRQYDSLLAVVLDVYDRVKKGQPATGKTKLRKRLGSWGMFALSKALRREKRDFKQALTSLVGFGLTRGEDKAWLDWWYKQYLANPPDDEKKPPGAVSTDGQPTAWDKRYTIFLNQLRRPGGCKQCAQIVTGEGGRNLGPGGADGKPQQLKRNLVCTSKSCVYCFMLQAVAELELLEDLWKDRPGEGEEGIYEVKAEGIEHADYLTPIRDMVSRMPDPKLGIVGWGDDGKPTLSYFVTSREAATIVTSQIEVGCLIAYGKRPEVSRRRFETTGAAIDAAIEARISFNMHARRLIEERRDQELFAWTWWAARKVPVKNPRNKKALPWPTKAQIQEQVKANKGEDWEPDIFEGEVLTYTLVHVATGYFLGRRKKIPYTLDQSMDIMAVNSGLQHAQAAAGGAATRTA